MDALEFVKIKRRICSQHPDCRNCPLPYCRLGSISATLEDDAELISKVEKWAKAHPIKTRQSEFLKMFPNAPICPNGALGVNPCSVEVIKDCVYGKTCDECRKDYWLKEIE